MSLILLGILNSQVTGGGGASAMELIESQILSSSAASVTFSSIPQDYKHLQIRLVTRNTDSGDAQSSLRLSINGVSTNSYASHYLYGTGALVYSSNLTSQNILYSMGFNTTAASSTGQFGANVLDILDYSSTSKNTTLRSFSGGKASNGQRVALASGLFISTDAVSSITFTTSGSYDTNSRLSIYGIRG